MHTSLLKAYFIAAAIALRYASAGGLLLRNTSAALSYPACGIRLAMFSLARDAQCRDLFTHMRRWGDQAEWKNMTSVIWNMDVRMTGKMIKNQAVHKRQALDAYLFAKVKQALLDCSQSVNFINGMV